MFITRVNKSDYNQQLCNRSAPANVLQASKKAVFKHPVMPLHHVCVISFRFNVRLGLGAVGRSSSTAVKIFLSPVYVAEFVFFSLL
jgi:hypothetical protein